MESSAENLAEAWDRRTEAILGHLPRQVGSGVGWLRHPDRRPARICSAVLLIIGGCLSILPVLGLWMLPVGLALLAEDVPGLKPRLEASARWCERSWRRLRRPSGA